MTPSDALDQIASLARAAQSACDAEICVGCPAFVSLDDDPTDSCVFDEILVLIETAQFQAAREVR